MNKNFLKCLGIFKEPDDNTIKNVFQTKSGEVIEMTLVQNKADADVFCVPSHHFCSLGCKMCHLTNKKINFGMVPISYDNFFEALIKSVYRHSAENLYNDIIEKSIPPLRRTSKQNCLISFMGVGEPLLNLELLKQIYLHEDEIKKATGYLNIGYALSTIFPHSDLLRLQELIDIGMPLKVHFSLHTPIDTERLNLLPGTKVTVKEAFQLLTSYRTYMMKFDGIMQEFQKLHQVCDPVEIHYTLIEGINDSAQHLQKLIELIQCYKIQLKFILFNPIGNLKRSTVLDYWLQAICRTVPDVNVVAYAPPGRGIGSSCGEFTRHYYHYQIETPEEYIQFKQWEEYYSYTD